MEIIPFPSDIERLAVEVDYCTTLAPSLRDEIEDALGGPVRVGSPPRPLTPAEWEVLASMIRSAAMEHAVVHGIASPERAWQEHLKGPLLDQLRMRERAIEEAA